jgi:hypothetical protein
VLGQCISDHLLGGSCDNFDSNGKIPPRTTLLW